MILDILTQGDFADFRFVEILQSVVRRRIRCVIDSPIDAGIAFTNVVMTRQRRLKTGLALLLKDGDST